MASLASRLSDLAAAIGADIKSHASRLTALEANPAGPGAFARASVAGQQLTDVANGGAYTAIAFTTDAAHNTAGIHSTVTNPSRFTAPISGPYFISASVWANTFITAGRVSGSLRVNGAEIALEQDNLTSQAGRALVVSAGIYLNAGDYVELFVEISNTGVNPVSVAASMSIGVLSGPQGPKGNNTSRQNRYNVPTLSSAPVSLPVVPSTDLGWKLTIMGQVSWATGVAHYPFVRFNAAVPSWNLAEEDYLYINGGALTRNYQQVKSGVSPSSYGFIMGEIALGSSGTGTGVLYAVMEIGGATDVGGNEYAGISRWHLRGSAGNSNFEAGHVYNSVEYSAALLPSGITSLDINWDGVSFKGDIICEPILK